MKFCTKCGKELMDEAVICPGCGCACANTTAYQSVAAEDAPNTGFWVLGFFFPIVGLILYLVNRETKPKAAASAGKGAIVGLVVGVVASVLLGILSGCTVLLLDYL